MKTVSTVEIRPTYKQDVLLYILIKYLKMQKYLMQNFCHLAKFPLEYIARPLKYKV